MFKRAHIICSSNEDLQAELQHLNEVFDLNNYPHTICAQRNRTIEQTNNGDIQCISDCHALFRTSKARQKELREF